MVPVFGPRGRRRIHSKATAEPIRACCRSVRSGWTAAPPPSSLPRGRGFPLPPNRFLPSKDSTMP